MRQSARFGWGQLKRLKAWYEGRQRQAEIRDYLAGERRPWTRGYGAYKMEQLRALLADDDLRRRFLEGEALPETHGYRLDCRAVEMPWVFAELGEVEAGVRLLDAGSGLNHAVCVEHPAIADKDLTILTLVPEGQSYWRRRISYQWGDLREMPFRDEWFDGIVCISTLEHVGMNNTNYSADLAAAQASSPDDHLVALAELRRVLRPGGTLWLTLPYGLPEDHGWLHQFDAAKVDRLIEAFAPVTLTEEIFRYTRDGVWVRSDRDEAAQSRYFDFLNRDIHTEMPSHLPAAEEAVVCLRLVR